MKENLMTIAKLKTLLRDVYPIKSYNVLNFEFTAIFCKKSGETRPFWFVHAKTRRHNVVQWRSSLKVLHWMCSEVYPELRDKVDLKPLNGRGQRNTELVWRTVMQKRRWTNAKKQTQWWAKSDKKQKQIFGFTNKLVYIYRPSTYSQVPRWTFRSDPLPPPP